MFKWILKGSSEETMVLLVEVTYVPYNNSLVFLCTECGQQGTVDDTRQDEKKLPFLG